MATRICSCCGISYTDEEGHDLEKCVDRCRENMNQAIKAAVNSTDDLIRSYQRLTADLKEKLKNK